MLSPANAYHDKIKDPLNYRQNIVLAFEHGYFSANDGDIVSTGATFDKYYCTSEDINFGECPSDTMSVSLNNRGERLRSFVWGEARAYAGYLHGTADTPLADGTNAEYTYAGTGANITFSARTDGFYIDNTLVQSGECYSLLVLTSGSFKNYPFAYAFGVDYAYRVQFTLAGTYNTPELITPTAFMIQKMSAECKCVVFTQGNTLIAQAGIFDVTVAKNGKTETWKYAPLGVFQVGRPTSLANDTVDIVDALDRMRLFEADATAFLEHFNDTYAEMQTAETWLTELCSWVQVPVATSTLVSPNSGNTYSYKPNTSVSLRDILGWLAENYLGVLKFDRMGRLALYKVGTASVEEIGLDRTAQGSLEMQEAATRRVEKIINKNLSGLTYVQGAGENVYSIYGNPFVTENEVTLADVAFPSYVPMALTVLEADPLVDTGDIISVRLTDAEFRAFVDAYNRAFTDENGRIFIENVQPVTIPLLHQKLTWKGAFTALYEATGNAVRENESWLANVDYNANIANDTENIINHIKTHGLTADWIIAGILKSINGKFYVDMDSGETNLANVKITDGEINIETESTASPTARDIIRLFHKNPLNNHTWLTEITDGWVTVTVDGYSTADTNGKATFFGTYLTLEDIDGTQRALLAKDMIRLSGANGNTRVLLDYNGLKFYDANGNLTKSYPAT